MGKFTVSHSAWYNQLPEYELEGLWGCAIENGLNNSLTEDKGVPIADANNVNFDLYIKSVSIPQLKLEAESTTFGLINYTGKSAFDNVTIEFYDDVDGTCLNFFNTWLSAIYDIDNHAFRSNWRYEDKDIFVEYYRKFRKARNIKEDTKFVKPIVQYHLVRCLPISIDVISAEESGGERKTFSVTLTTQRVIDNFGKDIETKCDDDIKEQKMPNVSENKNNNLAYSNAPKNKETKFDNEKPNPDTSYDNIMKSREPKPPVKSDIRNELKMNRLTY